MVTIEQALDHIEFEVTRTEKTLRLPVSSVLGYVLAENIVATISMPPFRQSAMDGYAVKLHDSHTYRVVGEVKAGDAKDPVLQNGEAVRIFTGAPVPEDANAIVIQELVTVDGDLIHVNGEVKPSANIRPQGEQIKEGETALVSGTHITPATVGFLASLGVAEVEVFQKPSVGIVVTGNELREPGTKLGRGEIYESNAMMLTAALVNSGYSNTKRTKVGDTYGDTVAVLRKALEDFDVLLISGGISVGDYDFVGRALEEIGVRQIFYKVKQKPGKPLFMGKKEEKLVFALPGNPASALSCFYVYALPAINSLSGIEKPHLTRRVCSAKNNFNKRGDRPQFVKALVDGDNVTILDGQASSMIHTFSIANALGYLPSECSEINKGDQLEVLLLP